MAVTNIIRRTASQVVPLAVRVIGRTQSYYHHRSSALFSTVVNHSAASRNFFRSSAPSTLHFYSTKRPSSDESLLKVIQSEIQCVEESDEKYEVDEAPEGFPFKIEDHPGQQTIALTREYQGECIDVEVHMPDLVTGDEDEHENVGEDDNEGVQSQIPLVVRVSKKNGPSLEFGITAFADEISIDTLTIKDPNVAEDQIAYEGPDFSDLDENLQKAFHKYLEIRGIKPSTTNFLHEYMLNKDGREYKMWLKNLKKFIEA